MSTPPLAEDFGTWLRRLRRQRDRTQEALADEVGCAVYTLRAIEAGRRRPSREMAGRLAAVLGLPENQRSRFIQLARSGQAPEDVAPGDGSPAPPPAAIQLPDLLTTKLYAPPPPPFVVPRARLLTRLAAHPARLTLLVAPPGFGKSTLLVQLLAQPARSAIARTQTGPAPAAAWLSLDVDDDEPARFLSAVIAALQQQIPNLGTGALNLLRMAPDPQPQAVLSALINDLRRHGAELALVLDDYHTMGSPAIHELLTTLVERAPPGLRLLLASRSDPPLPLARWRARGLLAELRATDLRFDEAEAASFLVEGMGLALSAEEVALLDARTEGWAAGLQLAGLSLRGRADTAGFLAAFGGSNRFVLDYLVTETLGSLPGHLRSFLLQTAVLRRLCAPLCDAVLGLGAAQAEDEAYSRVLLGELERRSMFLIPLDDEGRWWRYHHLFSEALQAQLRAGIGVAEVATLHGRAAQWYAGAGYAEEAFHHALAADDTALAAEILERAAPDLVSDHALPTLLRLLRTLPPQTLIARPALAAYAVWTLIETGQTVEAEDLGQALAAQLPPEASPVDRGHLLGAQAHLAVVHDQYGEGVRLARAAVALLEASAAPFRREVLDVLFTACESADDLTGALEAATANAALLRKRGRSTVVADVQMGSILVIQGRTAEAETRLKEALATCADHKGGLLPSAALPLLTLGRLYLDRGELDSARSFALRALTLAEQYQLTYVALPALWVLTFAHLCGRTLAAGRAEARRMRATALRAGSTLWQRTAEELEVELAVLAGEREAAARWAEQALAQLSAMPVIGSDMSDYALGCLRVLITVGRSDDALPLVRRMLAAKRAAGRLRSILFFELYEAMALHSLGRDEEALNTLADTLGRAEAQGAVCPFLAMPEMIADLLPSVCHVAPTFVERLIVALAERDAALRSSHDSSEGGRRAAPLRSQALLATPPEPTAAQGFAPLTEPLSERELEVLRLLAAGRSNQAIADELIIAVGTVKRHLHSIFGKLDVESRAEAIARAHTLGLVTPAAG